MVKHSIDVLGLRDEIMDYLGTHTYRRQEIIADLVGIRRESLYAYTTKRSGLTHVEDIQRLYNWMVLDRANQQTLTRPQMAWLLRHAQQNLREARQLPPRQAKRAVAKWSAKLRKYRKVARKMGKVKQ
jgi:hypothetical protein